MINCFRNTFFSLFLLFSCNKENKVSNNGDDFYSENKIPKVLPKTILKNALKDSIDFLIPRHYIDSLFSIKKSLSHFEEQRFIDLKEKYICNTVLMIGNFFSPNIKSAILAYKTNDTTLYCKVLKFDNGNWVKYFEASLINKTWHDNQIVEIIDLNGDHIPDLKILKDVTLTHTSQIAYAWIFNNHDFLAIENFDSLTNAEYNPVYKTLNSYSTCGCGDLCMLFSEYNLTVNKILKKKEIYCACCFEKYCDISINNFKTFKVKKSEAYKYVPLHYRERVREKLL